MNTARNTRVIGIVSGTVLFVGVGLTAMIGVQPSTAAEPTRVTPLTPEMTAPARALSDAFAAVAAHVRPAVVSVTAEKSVKVGASEMPSPFGDDFFRQFFGEQMPGPAPRQGQGPSRGPREYKVPQQGMGSGIIIDKEGHILTNNHVVSDVDELKVQLADKRTFAAQVIGTDPRTDVAVIQIKGSVPADLPVAELGDSDALQPGALVIAVGAPFGLTQTVTQGIISAVGRADVGIADYEDFLQTDAAINPGNSGGPLVNMRGEVIGMNSAIATHVGQFAGVGFAIPVNMIKSLLPVLKKGGKISRGMLGVVIQDLTKDLAKQFQASETKGALVAQVTKESAAEKAGVKVGDIIVNYNGNPITDTRHLRNLVAATAPGAVVKIELMRNGKREFVSATIGKQTGGPAVAESGAGPSGADTDQLAKLGLGVQALTPELAQQLGIGENKGVVVTQVDPGSPAALAGLQQGDLIVEADRQKVPDVQALQSLVSKVAGQETVLLLIKRKEANLFVVMALK